MAIYTKTARQMLVDLINESNPELPFSINTIDYDFTDPVSIPVTEEDHNTEIRIIAKPSSPYVGNRLLTYRRLNLAYLFRNITPKIQQWVENTSNVNSTTVRATLHRFLPLYSKKYGINLEASQIRQVNLTERMGLVPTEWFSITAENKSLVFVGSTEAQWSIGRRRLSELLQIDEVNGRHYPAYNNTVRESEEPFVDYRPLLTQATHHIDFTLYAQENASDWTRLTSATILTSYQGSTHSVVQRHRQELLYRTILDESFKQKFGFGINTNVGLRNTVYDRQYTAKIDAATATAALGGISYMDISLPHADFPEANSEFFNSAVVFLIPEDCPWGVGNVFLHYNR